MKENDYFLNSLSNPTFNPQDFLDVGLTPQNTSIEKAEEYLKYDALKSNPAFINNQGQFDESKFNKIYNRARNNYELFTALKSSEDLGNNKIFHRNDIFAPKALRKDNVPEYNIQFVGNPHRQTAGFKTFGLTEAPIKSDREIAQTQQVWDPKTKEWHDAPNDSFFGDFFDTRVIAQYDEDEKDEYGNIIHQKGERKIDPNTGTFYYENLNGRDIYGRDVLSRFDTLTVDGSVANKYDFFDSDDLDKSIGGSLMRSAIKLAPAFIPGVAPWYIGARVGLNLLDLMPKVGKMIVGSDSSILSGVEGFAHTFDLSSSDYAQNHPWSVENILNLSSDVFTQLAEQRWLFNYAPSLLNKSKLGFDEKTQEKFIQDTLKNLNNNNVGKIKDIAKNVTSTEELLSKAETLKGLNAMRAQQALVNQVSNYSKLGEQLSKAYMVGVTVADSYEEAKQSGLSDLEAALFTLGYGWGEYKILNTQLGEMILPELRMDRTRRKQLIKQIINGQESGKALKELGKSQLNGATQQEKSKWAQQWMKKGEDAAASIKTKIKQYFTGELDELKSAGKIGTSHLIANALGEGVEETSEELLLDLSKTLFNASTWITGSKSHLNAFNRDESGKIQWDSLLNRYGLSFVGGLIGGGLGQALPGYQEALKIKQMDQQSAWQEMVYLIKEGKGEELKDLVRKMPIGNEYLGITTDAQGNFETNPNKTQNEYQQENFINLINQVESILNTNDINISDESLINHLTLDDQNKILNDLKLINLQKSDVLGYYVQDFNTTITNIAKLSKDIYDLEHRNTGTDSNPSELSEDDQKLLNRKKNQLQEELKRKEQYLDGTMSKEFIQDSLFEMSDAIRSGYDVLANFHNYVQAIEAKPANQVGENRLQELKEQWEAIKESGQVRQQIHQARQIFSFINQKFSDSVRNHDVQYFNDTEGSLLQELTDSLITDSKKFGQKGNRGILEAIKNTENITENATQHFDVNGTNSTNSGLSRNVVTISTLVNALGNDQQIVQNITNAINLPINRAQFNKLSTVEQFNFAKSILTNKLGVSELSLTDEYLKELKDKHPELIVPETKKDSDNLNSTEQELLINQYIVDQYNTITDKDLQDYQENQLKLKIKDVLVNNFDNIKELLNKSKYIKPSIKQYLDNFFKEHLLYKESEEEEGNEVWNRDEFDDPADQLYDRIDKYNEIKTILDSLNNSPIQDLLDKFQLTVKDSSIPLSKVMQILERQLQNGIVSKDLSEFGTDDDIAEMLNNGIKLIEMLQSHIAAARVDNRDVNNVFGYNNVINQLIPDLNLAEIDKFHAESIIYDLNKYKTQLEFYKKLYEANSGQKVEEVNKTSNLFRQARFQKLKHFIISIIPDDWEDDKGSLAKLREAFNDLNNSELNKSEINNTDQALKELLNCENAVHEYFQTIQDKLKDPEQFRKVFNNDNFHLLNLDETPVNKNLKELSILDRMNDSSFIHYLATLTAINPQSYYKELENILNPNFIPIDAQIFATQEAYAYLMNRQIFDMFNNIYNDIVTQDVLIKTDQELSELENKFGIHINKEAGLNTDVHIQFKRHFFIEGIAGSGKSSACYTLLKALLQNGKHDDLLKNVWFVHKSEEQARQAAKEAGFDESKVTILDKNSYLRRINKNYIPVFNESGIQQIDISQLKEDTETKLPKYDLEIETVSNPPSLVIIDEGTNFSQQDFLFSEDFLEKYKTQAIVTGDYNQISESHSTGDEHTPGDYFGTSRNNFPHSPKLGISMRTDNLIKDQNLAAFDIVKQDLIKSLVNKVPISKIANGFVLNQEGLFGDKHEKILSDEVKQTIKLMYDTLKDKEQLHIITNDQNSELAQYIKTLGDKIDFQTSFNAQGQEGQYYLVDLDSIFTSDYNSENAKYEHHIDKAINVIQQFYTFLSRSKQGTLLVGKLLPFGDSISFTNNEQYEVKKLPITQEQKQKQFENLKNAITKALEGKTINPIQYIPEEGKPKDESIDSTETDSLEENNLQNITQRNTTEFTIKTPDENPNGIEMLIHTFNCTETGLIKNDDGSFSIPENATFNYDNYGNQYTGYRVDNALGLIKLLKDPNTHKPLYNISSDGKIDPSQVQNLLNQVARIRQLISTSTDINQLKSDLRNIFNIDIGNISMAFKVVENDDGEKVEDNSKNWKGLRGFFKSLQEWIYGVPSSSNTSPQNKNLVALVTDMNGKIIYETSICSFTNPLSLMQTRGYKDVVKAYDEWKNTTEGQKGNFSNFADLLISNNIKNGQNIAKLFKVYSFNTKYHKNINIGGKLMSIVESQFITPLKDQNGNDFLPANLFKSLGLTVTTKEKGTNFYLYSDNYEWKKQAVKITDLQIPGRYISKVYASKNNFSEAKAGQPFVLVCDDANVRSEDAAFELLTKQLNGEFKVPKVKVLHVSPPGVSIAEYIENCRKVFSGDEKDYDITIGNEATHYRILHALVNSNSEFSKALRNTRTLGEDSNKTNVHGPIQKWECIRHLIEYLDSLSTSERIEALDKPVPKEVTFINQSGKQINYKLTWEGLNGETNYLGSDKGKLRFVINQAIRSYLVQPYWGTTFKRNESTPEQIKEVNTIIEERIKLIEQDLNNPLLNKGFKDQDGNWVTKDIKISNIQYNLPFASTESGVYVLGNNLSIVPLQVSSDYKYEGKDILTNGKCDTSTYVGEVGFLLDQIINAWEAPYEERQENLRKYQHQWDEKSNTFDLSNVDNVPSDIKLTFTSTLKSKDQTLENLTKLAWQQGYFIIKQNGKLKFATDANENLITFNSSIQSFNNDTSSHIIETAGKFILENGSEFNWDGNQIVINQSNQHEDINNYPELITFLDENSERMGLLININDDTGDKDYSSTIISLANSQFFSKLGVIFKRLNIKDERINEILKYIESYKTNC